MVQIVKLKYINEQLSIGMSSWREVYIYSPTIIQLNPEVDRGRLVYRFKGSKRRFSYNQIKKGLVKKNHAIQLDLPSWF